MKHLKGYNLAKILLVLFSAHLVVSLSMILFPSPLGANKGKDIYRRYLLPGPFFNEQRVNETHILYISRKDRGDWQSPVNPTLNHFHHFFSSWKPSLIYKTRLERSIYENFQIASESKSPNDLNFDMTDLLKYYVKEQDFPEDFDSARMILLKKVTKDFMVTTDTLQTLKF